MKNSLFMSRIMGGIKFLMHPWPLFYDNALLWILGIYLTVGWIEMSIGMRSAVYRIAYRWFYNHFGLSWKVSLWIILFLKLFLVVFLGARLLSYPISWIGKAMGAIEYHADSLQRRLCILFLMVVLANSLRLLGFRVPEVAFLSLALFVWAFTLAFISVKEKFQFDLLRTCAIFTLSLFLTMKAHEVVNNLSYPVVRSLSTGRAPHLSYLLKQVLR